MDTNEKNFDKPKSINDMTVGSPFKIIWNFSMPMLLSVVFQQLYNIVDSIIAGKFIGVDALAAVGASYPITVLFIAVATGSSMGCSVIVSQLFGSKRYNSMKSSISTSIISITILSVILTLIGFIICNPLLNLMNTPLNIFKDSSLYLKIYILGVIFLFIYNTATAIFNALGNSKTPLLFLIFSSIFNVVLDLIFVKYFNMGVSGLAWGTFIAQGISSILSIACLLFKINKIKTESKYRYFNMDLLKSISRIAIPSIMQQSFVSIGQLCVQGLVNSYGSVVVAGYSAAFKINTFVITAFTTMSSALSSFTAQNIGANKIDRVVKGYKSSLFMSMVFTIIIIIITFIFGENLLGLFVDTTKDKDVVTVGLRFMKTVTPFYVVIVTKIVADGVLRGSGDMKEFMIGTFTDLVLRVVLSYVLSGFIGYAGIWCAFPLGWIVGTIISLYFYYKGNWKIIKAI